MCAMIKQSMGVNPIDLIEDRSYLTGRMKLVMEIDSLHCNIEELNKEFGADVYFDLLRKYEGRINMLNAELEELDIREQLQEINSEQYLLEEFW